MSVCQCVSSNFNMSRSGYLTAQELSNARCERTIPTRLGSRSERRPWLPFHRERGRDALTFCWGGEGARGRVDCPPTGRGRASDPFLGGGFRGGTGSGGKKGQASPPSQPK